MSVSIYYNRVKFNSTTSSTSDFGVGSNVSGFRTPAQASANNGDVVSYTAESADLAQWETGQGQYNTTGPKIQRTVVYESATGIGVAMNFTNPPIVRIDALSQDLVGILVAGAGNPIVTAGNSVITTAGGAPIVTG